MLDDKQNLSVGRFDVVAFYTLFRVHLTLEFMHICPKKVLNRSFSGFLLLDDKCMENDTFGRISEDWKQWNSADEESSNGTSQDEVSSHLAGKLLTTASQESTRRRRN